MNLITEYFTYTHLVNVIQQTVKGKVCRIFGLPLLHVTLFMLPLSFRRACLSCFFCWKKNNSSTSLIPPPPKKSPKQNSDCCLFREEISPGLRTNCLEKSLQRSDPRLSTAYCRGVVGGKMRCVFSCPSWYWGKRKGPGQEVFEKTNPIAESSVSAR